MKNVEVEGGELAIKNSHGDIVIIPKKNRLKVEGMIKDKCWECIDSFVDTLPVMADYAEDGSLYSEYLTQDPPDKKNPSDPNSDGSLPSYFEGSEENPVQLEEITVTAEFPEWEKYKKQYIKDNPFNIGEYVETRFNNPIGREKIEKIDSEGWKKKLRQEGLKKRYDTVMNYVGEQIVLNKPQGDMSRAEWLNTLSDKEEEIVKRNPKYQSSLWADTKRGLASLVEQNALQTFQNILNSSDYSNREKREILKDYVEHPVMSKLGDAAKILSPLTVPSKMVQSAYRDDYSLIDALKGKKNNAGIAEDLVTDPLNFVGVGLAGKLSKVDKVIDATKAGSKVLSKVDDVIKPKQLHLKSTMEGEGISKLSNESFNLNEKLKNINSVINNSAENISYELSTIIKKLSPKYQKQAKAELEAANKWQKEWYSNPETKKRLEKLSEETNKVKNQNIEQLNKKRKLRRENPDNLKLGFTQEELNEIYSDIPYHTENEWTDILKRIDDENYKVTFQSKDAKLRQLLKGEPRTHKGNYGVSGHFLDNDYIGVRQNLVDKYTDKIKTTGIHEGNHGLTEGNSLIPSSEQENIVKIFGDDTKVPIRNDKMEFNTYDEYLEDPTEVYARIMELRAFMDKKPGDLVSKKDIDKLLELGKNGNTPVDSYFFDKIKNTDHFKLLFNRLPALIPIIGTAGYLQSQQNNKTK